MTLLAEVCARLGDVARADELYELLAPYAGRNVIVGRAAACNGSASRLLGALAAVKGEWARAERHFARRAGDARGDGSAPVHGAHPARLGGDGWLARGDVPRARELLADAIVAADALGMVVVAERARGLVAAPA